jgi:aldose 1-epimerase
VSAESFGRLPDGTEITAFTLTGEGGLKIKVMTYGATLMEVHAPDRAGVKEDVALGFSGLESYQRDGAFIGVTVGRVANRIANSQFTLEGVTYRLPANDWPHHLHGGPRGFHRRVWQAEASGDGRGVVLRYSSPAGEQGFPGQVDAEVEYAVTPANEIRIDYRFSADRRTPVNLTNHAYWNLAGHGSILGHEVQIRAERFVPVDAMGIPTGDLASVAGGPMDFRAAKPVGRDLGQLGNRPLGYDHTYVVDGQGLRSAAVARDPASGRTLEVLSTEPGIQFYVGSFLDGSGVGKRGENFRQYGGFCLETQSYPDSVNRPEFPSIIVAPGEERRSTTIYRFSAR